MSRLGNTRTIFERVFLIYKQLRLDRPVTIRSISTKLEVNRSTVIRDLDFMQDRLELPIGRSSKGVQLLMPIKLCPTCCKRLTDD
jgi:predicted DNA-binding transcriptional regulator YafY